MTNEVALQQEVDLLDRKRLAKNLLKIIKATNAHVYSINAPWGAGKTKFLSFIKEVCEEQQLPYIQLNAWETDYADIPFLAITSELITQLQNVLNEKCDVSNIQAEIEKLKKPAEKIINFLKLLKLKPSISYVFPSGTKLEAGCEMELKEETISLVQKIKNQKNIFKDAVQSVCKILGKDKIIIAIDELDRCHPHYAISALETIKHFFEIDNLVFILAVDKVQLENTVKTMFGFETNTDAYLKKFVDMQYVIPEPNSIFEFVKDLFENKYPHGKKAIDILSKQKSYLHFVEKCSFWECKEFTYEGFISIFCNICYKYHLRLRDIEKLVIKFSVILYLLSGSKMPVLHTEYLIQLMLINLNYSEIYQKIKNKTFSVYLNECKEIKILNLNEDFKRIYEAVCSEKTYDAFATPPKGTGNLYKNIECIKRYFNLIEFASNLE